MRKLAWAALPYAVSVFAAEYILPVKGLPWIAAALFALGFAGLLFRGKNRTRVMLACFFAALGLGWYAGHYALTVTPCAKLEKQTVSVTARVTDWPTEADSYSRVDVRLTGENTPHVAAALYLYNGELPALRPGDIIETEIYVAGDSDRFAAKDIYLRGYIRSPVEITGRWALRGLYFPRTVCKVLKESCDRVFPAFASPLVKAMMTGDTDSLKENAAFYAAIRSCGMSHVVAVSGLHMMYLVALFRLLTGREGKRSVLLCLGLILFFVFMTGCTPSVVRAAVIQSMLLLAPLFGRESDGITALSAALGLLLAVNPNAAASISLQLSFLAAAGLMLLCPPLTRWREKHIRGKTARRIADSVICTIGATAFSMPVAAAYFGYVPLLSVFVNLLALPVLELVFCAGYLLSLLGFLLPATAQILAWLPAAAVWLCRQFFQTAASLPFACAYTDSTAVVLWLVGMYVLFGAVWLLRRFRGKKLSYAVPAGLSICLLCGALVAAEISAGNRAELAVLDVGQGLCVCMHDGDDTVMVDCGGSGSAENAGDTAANYLRSLGQDNLDLLVLTHLHADHANGVIELLYRIPVSRLAFSEECFDDDALLEGIYAAAEDCGTQIFYVSEETAADVGAVHLSLCLPMSGTGENERGIVVAAEIGDKSILITGDMDSEGELLLAAAGRADTDILVAGHHGSQSSSSAFFLQAASPELSIISVGENSYGHPTRQALERLEQYSDDVCRTDLDGNVIVRIK